MGRIGSKIGSAHNGSSSADHQAGPQFTVAERVEVLSSEDGFSDAWASATIVSVGARGSGWNVEYVRFVDADGVKLKEKVRPP